VTDADNVYWIEDCSNPHKTTLRAVPRALEPFGSSLRALFGAGVFLSPAVIAGGHVTRDARSFLRAAGLQTTGDSGEAEVAVQRIAPTPKPNFFMAPFAPAPNAGEQMEAYARFLVEAAGPFLDQGVLVFCPSQTAVRALYGALRNALKSEEETSVAPHIVPSVRVLAQWIDGNRDAITRLYAAGRGGFVLATEGLPGLRDAEGRAPALWLLTRMPLPPPRDPLLEARGEPMRDEGKNARLELWHPAAILRVKREWAMLHREGAVGPRAVWLLDARAATEGLGARLGEALGAKVEVARSVEELREKTWGHLGRQ
jgi:Rad3-related DNA helicase